MDKTQQFIKMLNKLICLFIVQFLVQNAVGQNTYKAAVVEYSPRLSAKNLTQLVLENVQQYIELMEQAAEKNVQIIVFPEAGLTGLDDITYNIVDELSTDVPNPDDSVSPCTAANTDYPKFFKDLSCAAATNKIYTVVNLIERHYDNQTNSTIYHNTNMVFNRNGVVISRYRKINLFSIPFFVAGNITVSFKTDFGVTFGMFICFDIMFRKPAFDLLLDPEVTDIIYSTAWYSELPFYEGLSIQDGYVKTNGINLLAASLNDPPKATGGSGIYSIDGRQEIYVSGASATKMIIQDVLKLSARNAAFSCREVDESTRRVGGALPNISNFHAHVENTVNYTFKSINLDQGVIVETVCNAGFCCSFNIKVTKEANVQPNYVYKLLVYYGVSHISWKKPEGLRNCALVACLNETNSSCGERYPQYPTGVIFESISVKGTFNPSISHYQPATLKGDLLPLTHYTYCTRIINNEVEVLMSTTQPQRSLLTFGIYGRAFNYDSKRSGTSFLISNVYIALVMSNFVFLLQD